MLGGNLFSLFDLGLRTFYLWVWFFKMLRKSSKLSLVQSPLVEEPWWKNCLMSVKRMIHMQKHLKMKYSKDKDDFFSQPNAKRIMVNTLNQNLQNYWQCMEHLGYGASRQEKTREWMAVKLVKRESKSLAHLAHFSTTKSCYIIDSILCAITFVQTQSKCTRQSAFW